MKIKCPLCNRDKYTATKQLDLHLQHYHILVEKIHEKIEEREKEIEYLQNKDTLYLSPLRRNEEELRILKSLLDNIK